MASSHFKRVLEARTTGTNSTCDYYPCHHQGQDCTWCFCPFYPCMDELTGGRMVKSKRTGNDVWSCIDCTWIHREDAAREVMDAMEDMRDITDPDRERLLALRAEVLEKRSMEDIKEGLQEAAGTDTCRGCPCMGFILGSMEDRLEALDTHEARGVLALVRGMTSAHGPEKDHRTDCPRCPMDTAWRRLLWAFPLSCCGGTEDTDPKC